jgi:pimeloyl-ACP methyl ester carboxylesterase
MIDSRPAGHLQRTVPTVLGDLAVRTTGDGPTTVFWHSMFVDGSSWDGVVRALAGHRRCVVVDGPGYGDSAPLRRRSSIEESAAAAAEVIEAVSPGRSVDFVGNAWGGHIAMVLAADQPRRVRSVALLSAPLEPIDPALRRKVRALLVLMRLIGAHGPVLDAILQNQVTEQSRIRPEVRSAIGVAVQSIDRRVLIRTVQSFILDRTDAGHRLPSIAVPALLVTGDDRPEWTPERMAHAASRMTDAQTAVIPGTRTVLPLEAPAEVAAVLDHFWSARGLDGR